MDSVLAADTLLLPRLSFHSFLYELSKSSDAYFLSHLFFVNETSEWMQCRSVLA